MHLTEKGILNNSMSVFMHISCTADNLQFKYTAYQGGKKSLDDLHVQITCRKPAAGVGQRRKGGTGCGVRQVAGGENAWGDGAGRAVGKLLCHPYGCPSPTVVTDSSELRV